MDAKTLVEDLLAKSMTLFAAVATNDTSLPAHEAAAIAAKRKLWAALEQLDTANKEWHDKTEWLRKDLQPHELGMHLADVLRERAKTNTGLMREARDNARASIAEDGISDMRKQYRIDLHARLAAAVGGA